MNQHDSNTGASRPRESAPPANVTGPISLSVVIVIADARKSTRVFEAGREQSYAATPEALAALPGHLAGLLRGVSVDAQRELNRFLAVLAQPEPPAAAPEDSRPVSQTSPPALSSEPAPESAATNESAEPAPPNNLVDNNNNNQ